jgi:hypothetical protein
MLSRKQLWKKCCHRQVSKPFFEEPLSIPKLKKSITFNHIAHVKLIPKREEYIQSKLDDLLWYNEKELESFRNDYINYIKYGKYNTI